ncbi:MAG: PQQ-binding-like beta-propeller repeat protein [Oligoflexales bacterium]|nr:PQQ-binding-like beta-propeller repeat protein [Oligoflexales bacterium]
MSFRLCVFFFLIYTQTYLQASPHTYGIFGGVHPQSGGSYLERPLRSSFIKLSPQTDREKPAAAADHSGWVESSGFIIGAADNEHIVALHLNSSLVRWAYKTKEPLTAPAKIVAGRVMVGLKDGRLVCLELSSGNKLWEQNLNSFPSRQILHSGDLIFVVTAAQSLYAIQVQDGAVRWLYDGGFPEGVTVRSLAAPVAYENKVYYGLSSGEIVALNEETGELLWRKNPYYKGVGRFFDYVGRMAIYQEKLVISRYDGFVAALSLGEKNSAETAWTYLAPSAAITSSEFKSGSYYVGTLNGNVAEIRASDGKELWLTPLSASISNLTLSNERIFASSSTGQIHALRMDGHLVWTDDLRGSIFSAPFFSGSKLFFPTGLGNLYAYELEPRAR